MSLSQPSMDGILDIIAKEGCSSLLEEVFLDLEVGRSDRAPELSMRLPSSSVSEKALWLFCDVVCSGWCRSEFWSCRTTE